RPAEEGRRAAPVLAIEVGDFQRVQMFVVRVSDFRLAPEVKARHGDTMNRSRVRRDDDPARLIDGAVGGQPVGRGANDGRALIKRGSGDLQVQQNVLKLPDGCLWREYTENVEAEGCGELEAGENKDILEQAAIFGQRLLLVWPDAPKLLQVFEL